MSKQIHEQIAEQGGALLFLTPEEIIVDDDILKARPNYDVDQEQAGIEDLAKSMESQGQIEPIVVRWELSNGSTLPEDGHYHLVVGRRRRDAAMLINAGKSSKEAPYRLPAVVKQVDADEAFKMALAENLKRKNLNPIQHALVIKELRSRFKWDGAKGTKKVSDFLQVSPAFVTTHEKLMTLPEDMQAKVVSGDWSAQTAFEFLNTKEDKRKDVESTARQLQDEEERATVRTAAPGKKKTAKKKALKAKHVRAASREHQAAIAVKPLGRTEILKFWENIKNRFDGGRVHIFARSFLMYAEGKVRIETLTGHFETMVGDIREPDKKPAKKTSKPKK